MNSMHTGIFLLDQDGSLIEMSQTEFVKEASLQELIEKYPELIIGNQIDERDPRKWIVVSREVSIPDGSSSGGRWSIDHLLLDQDGIPTLVEVKRSTDTRIRREVIGQLLEYAANALNYWSVDTIRKSFELNCQKQGVSPDEKILNKFEIQLVEDFWLKVKSNLENGKLRLLLVADEIPFELKTIVEFLNEKMNDIEVLAVEIKQYIGRGNKTLVPRVIGQTTRNQIRKEGVRLSKQWDEEIFFKELENKLGSEIRLVAEKIYHWAKKNNLDIIWGSGSSNGSLGIYLFIGENKYYAFNCWTYDSVEILFQWMKKQKFLSDIESRKSLLEKLNKISGVKILINRIDYRPSISYKILLNQDNFEKFIKIWDSYFEKIRTLESSGNN